MYPTIFELIDAADPEGVLRFTYPTYLNDLLPANRQEALAEMVERELHNAGFATPRIGRGKWADVVQAQGTKNGDGEWEVRINLAKALLLPGVRPTEELAELRGFFSAIKDATDAHGADRLCIQFLNERDRHGKVYGDAKAYVLGPTNPSTRTDMPLVTAALLEPVAQSPVLSSFMREVALSLGKVGRYSWWTCTESHLYPEHEGPYFTHRRAEMEAKRLASAPEASNFSNRLAEIQAKRSAPAPEAPRPAAGAAP